MDRLRGLKWYLVLVILGLSFYSYSQIIGWRWIWSTKTEPPSKEEQLRNRNYYHK